MHRVTEANLDGHRVGFEAGVRLFCSALPDETVRQLINTYMHNLVFDDTKPCTCGGKQDGLHSRICERRRI